MSFNQDPAVASWLASLAAAERSRRDADSSTGMSTEELLRNPGQQTTRPAEVDRPVVNRTASASFSAV